MTSAAGVMRSPIDRRQLLSTGAAGLALFAGGCTTLVGTRSNDLIGDLQERTFRFFWETTNSANGLAPDRWPTPSFASIAAVGFALTAYPIGVVHGWITRIEARQRTLRTLEFFANAPQGDAPVGTTGYRGFFYHFLDMTTGHRFRDTELSTIDTALLMGGVLFAQSWFDSDHPDEKRIRALADQLYGAIDWAWITPRSPFVAMGWKPEGGFLPSDWDQYNESLLLYILALGSPTHALRASTWDRWSERFERQWRTDQGAPHIGFPPMFGHQYSHIWVDFRGIRDRFVSTKGIDYFENSVRATYWQRAYAIANPGGWRGYDKDIWGLTACDGPGHFKLEINGQRREFLGYAARGPTERDDGTIAPTAAIGSMMFAPNIIKPTVRAMHDRYGSAIYGQYGFLDSFNPTLGADRAQITKGRIIPDIAWVDDDYLGIDQGPILAGIENHRTGMIWQTMRRNAHLRRGLTRAGFTGAWLIGDKASNLG